MEGPLPSDQLIAEIVESLTALGSTAPVVQVAVELGFRNSLITFDFRSENTARISYVRS
jgi:hypothetical protein